jgi:integrase
METDDEARWLVALISDTGMRSSEAAGLSKEDVHLDADIPYVEIRPHKWRRLKTKSSIRKLPLVGASLWAARQAYIASIGRFMFPRYCNETECQSNSASAALNKWLKTVAGSDYVMHSFRHSMRDRLRAVNCPADMIDQIGGWRKKSVGECYGEGYSLSAICIWLLKTNLNIINSEYLNSGNPL